MGRFARKTNRLAAANRTAPRKMKLFGRHWAQISQDPDHIGNNIASPLDNDRIAYSNIQSPDLVLIMQSSSRHRNSADIDRLQYRHRRQNAGATDLQNYVFDPGG